MFSKKIKKITKLILVLILLVPVTFRVYDSYYSKANWDMNSKIVKRGKTYREYEKAKNKVGIPEVYFTYKNLTPEEMMSLDILSNVKGYNEEGYVKNIKKFVLLQNGKSLPSTLSKKENMEVDKYRAQVKNIVKDNLAQNSTYIYSMKIFLSIATALMIIILVYDVFMAFVFMREK